MKDIEERLSRITHDTLHYLADIYKAISIAQDKVNKICEKLLLDKQEIKDLKEKEGKDENN